MAADPFQSKNRYGTVKDPFVPWLMMKLRFKKVFVVSTWADQAAFLVAIFLLAGIPLAGAQAWVSASNTKAVAKAEQSTGDEHSEYPGARAIGTNRVTSNENPIPSTDPKSQYERLDGACDGVFKPKDESLSKYCNIQTYGADDAPLTVIVGNSHIEQSLLPSNRSRSRPTPTCKPTCWEGACTRPKM